MASTFTVDDTLYRMQIRKLARKLGIEEHKLVKEEAGLLAQLFAKVTPPFKSFPRMAGRPSYVTPGAQKQGANAVKTDFNRAIKRMGTVRKWKSKSVRDAIRSGDTNRLTEILRNMKNSNKRGLKVEKYSDRLHKRQRGSRGRISRSVKPVVAITNADVNAGMKRAVGNVGIAKAAFAKAAFRLGRPRPPAWIARHFSKVRTSVILTKKPARAQFTATAKGLDVTSSRIKAAERFRLKGMVLKLKRMVKSSARKSGFKAR